MVKKLMMTTVLSGMMIGAALAQSAPGKPDAPAATPSTPPAATTPAPKAGTTAAMPAAGSVQVVNSQRADQWLASQFRGTDVIGSDNQKIGDVSDILFGKDGQIEAYVVSVGGFLGMGAKDVALAPASFQVVAGDKSKNESDKLKLTMTNDQLTKAARFEPYKEPRTTTGMGGAPRPAPAPR